MNQKKFQSMFNNYIRIFQSLQETSFIAPWHNIIALHNTVYSGLDDEPCTCGLHRHFSVNTAKIFKPGFKFHVSSSAPVQFMKVGYII